MEFGGQNLKLDKEQLKMNYNAKELSSFCILRMQNELRCELVTSSHLIVLYPILDFDHPNMEFGGQNLKLDKEQLKMNYNAKRVEPALHSKNAKTSSGEL